MYSFLSELNDKISNNMHNKQCHDLELKLEKVSIVI